MGTIDDEFLPPSVAEIEACAQAINPYVVSTPTYQWSGSIIEHYLRADSKLHLKLELFQRTGTFKARAAINNGN